MHRHEAASAAMPLRLVLGLVAATLAGTSTAAADGLQFKPSALPPPAAEEPMTPSFYNLFETGDLSPMGTDAKTIKPSGLIDQAASFLNADGQHKQDPREAAFWLKRAILMAPDENGKRRAWAITNLALITYNSGDTAGHIAARYLWEIAGAWNNPEALCNLAQLTEIGDDVAAANPKKAIVWYERAKKAGCPQADEALSRLRP